MLMLYFARKLKEDTVLKGIYNWTECGYDLIITISVITIMPAITTMYVVKHLMWTKL